MAYLRRFLVTLFALLAAVAAVNALIDPYGVLGAPLIDGINQTKDRGSDRFFKPLQIELRQPHTLLIGTSRVAVGFDTRDVPGGEAYNLGLLGSTIGEHIAFARYAVANAPIERIVVGLDFEPFVNRAEYRPAFRLAALDSHPLWRNLPDLLISQRTLLESRNTLLKSRRHEKPRYGDDGTLIGANLKPDGATPRERVLNWVDNFARDRAYARGEQSRERVRATLAEFDGFLAGLPPRIAVYAFVAPVHAALRETLKPTGRDAAYDPWLRGIARICAAHRVPLWDFAGYNRITTVAMAESDEYFFDGSHTKPAIGRLILDTLLRGRPTPGFGVRLTPDMLPAYLVEQREAAETWRSEHPDDAREAAAVAEAAAAR
jgi:hypothetical protein